MIGTSVKPETKFRRNQVLPFLKTLKNTTFFALQQVAICGDPDYVLCMNGKFVALELKDDGATPRPLQQYKLDEVKKAKGVALAASPSNWEEIKVLLFRLSKGDI